MKWLSIVFGLALSAFFLWIAFRGVALADVLASHPKISRLVFPGALPLRPC